MKLSMPVIGRSQIWTYTLGLMFVLTGCSGGGGNALETLSTTPIADVALEPGDALRVSFSREPELDGDYVVDQTGSAALPLLGSRDVTSMSASSMRENLLTDFQDRINNQAVQVTYLRRVRVLGEVRSPGLFHADPTMSFEDLLALAGGADDDGNLNAVRLIRDGREIGRLDVRRSIGLSIHSGDQILVPKTSWFSRNAAILAGASISALGAIIAFTR